MLLVVGTAIVDAATTLARKIHGKDAAIFVGRDGVGKRYAMVINTRSNEVLEQAAGPNIDNAVRNLIDSMRESEDSK